MRSMPVLAVLNRYLSLTATVIEWNGQIATLTTVDLSKRYCVLARTCNSSPFLTVS